jgi:hypothetical protein
MEPQYNDLSSILNQDLVAKWTREADLAETARGEALRIYDVKHEKGTLLLMFISKPWTKFLGSQVCCRNPPFYDRKRSKY